MSFSPNSRVNKNNLSRSCNIWPIWLAINQTIYLRIHECVLRRGILMVTRSLLCLYLWMVNWSTRRLDLNISKWQWWAVYQTEPEEPYSRSLIQLKIKVLTALQVFCCCFVKKLSKPATRLWPFTPEFY